jgi:hypothetical protein
MISKQIARFFINKNPSIKRVHVLMLYPRFSPYFHTRDRLRGERQDREVCWSHVWEYEKNAFVGLGLFLLLRLRLVGDF